MNKVILTGRLTKDPTIKILNDNVIMSTISLAVNNNYKSKKTGKVEAIFVNVNAFSRNAELLRDYCKKGDLILVEGSINIFSIQNEDGSSARHFNVNMERVEFLQSKKSNSNSQNEASNFDINYSYEDDEDYYDEDYNELYR